jgi:hypothetical protein
MSSEEVLKERRYGQEVKRRFLVGDEQLQKSWLSTCERRELIIMSVRWFGPRCIWFCSVLCCRFQHAKLSAGWNDFLPSKMLADGLPRLFFLFLCTIRAWLEIDRTSLPLQTCQPSASPVCLLLSVPRRFFNLTIQDLASFDVI